MRQDAEARFEEQLGALASEKRQLERAKVRMRGLAAAPHSSVLVCPCSIRSFPAVAQCLVLSPLACQERLQHQSEDAAKRHAETVASVEKRVRFHPT